MHPQLVNKILDAGRDVAYKKMTLDRNSGKPDMRVFLFADLQDLLEHEIVELKAELLKIMRPGQASEEELNSIRDEAGDVIAFACGIVAKCDQELSRLRLKETPSLFDDPQ